MMSSSPSAGRPAARRAASLALGALAHAPLAHASFLSGDALDAAADVLAWIVLVIVPVVVIALFWMVHVLPEKVAERNQHPQAQAIKVLCLLSLVFGGLLWPLAWLWAYSKPVFYKMAYGTDRVAHDAHEAAPDAAPAAPAPVDGAR